MCVEENETRNTVHVTKLVGDIINVGVSQGFCLTKVNKVRVVAGQWIRSYVSQRFF